MTISAKPITWGEVDETGRLVIPAEIAAQYGFKPGSKVLIERDNHGVRLHQPVSHLAKLYLEPSGRCNLDCVTCMRNVWLAPDEIMAETTFNQIMAGLPEFSPPPLVFFGGIGEPLMHPQLPDMIAQVKALGSRVELITNGTLLTERLSRQLVGAGLDLLWVSLDGATPESYADVRLGASLPKVLANLKRFSQVRSKGHRPIPEIGIAFVAMQRNIHDLPEVMRIGRQLRATRLSVSNVLPYTEAMCQERLYEKVLNSVTFHPSPWMRRMSLPKLNPGEVLGQVLSQVMDMGWNIEFAGNNLGTSNNTCPFIESGAMAIGWDGGASPCPPLLHSHISYWGNRHYFSHQYVIGNLADMSLRELWEAPEHQTYRRKVQGYEFAPCTSCGGCELIYENKEDCFGNEFPTCSNCLWSQGVIQCP
ncbi:MAG: SPASM domain-containing protein [Anaerolineae bacterium]|nr:SPASM domain-containing protein [Anaerolineae bacterium]